ncbi:hypothetical protein JTB14_002750 [Gonioctena quinquepunctata]|nr:hypothetical protein JTB14_002750 [Gonioctena quinquepunctata]
MCNLVKYIETERKKTTDTNHMGINSSVVLGAVSTGIGYSQLEQIAASIDMPIMSDKTYMSQHEQLAHIIYSSVSDTIQESAKSESDMAKELGDMDENGIPCITVVTDGAWSKRSYNVNYDAASEVVSIFI